MKILAVLLLATLLCCGSHRGQDDDKMPECDAYATRLQSCLGADSKPAAIARSHTPENVPRELRAQMRAACARDLERISRSCH
jgi:hypothetical protein